MTEFMLYRPYQGEDEVFQISKENLKKFFKFSIENENCSIFECPCCGSEHDHVFYTKNRVINEEIPLISIMNGWLCLIKCPICGLKIEGFSPQECIQKWNTRNRPDDIQKFIGCLFSRMIEKRVSEEDCNFIEELIKGYIKYLAGEQKHILD